MNVPGEEHEIMATALEAEAALQERGSVREIGENYDPTYGRILEINADYDESVGFAFTFWDNWVDASNHEWQYHDPITEHEWPRFAREIAQAVRRGELPRNDFLIEQIRLKPLSRAMAQVAVRGTPPNKPLKLPAAGFSSAGGRAQHEWW